MVARIHEEIPEEIAGRVTEAIDALDEARTLINENPSPNLDDLSRVVSESVEVLEHALATGRPLPLPESNLHDPKIVAHDRGSVPVYASRLPRRIIREEHRRWS